MTSIKPKSFDRTVCACDECKACCKRQPGPLMPGDFKRIASYLGETPENAKRHFRASPGALVGLRDGRIVRIGTITPRMEGGRCVFLTEGDRCGIHAVAPFGCAYFDVHMDKATADERSKELVCRQATDREYQILRQELKQREEK